MSVHKSRSIHGWRELLKEIGIIVLGVLIALAAEQWVQALHENQVAEQARRNVRDEAKFTLEFMRDRLAAQHCIDDRIEAVAGLLARAGAGPLDPAPRWLGHPPTSPIFVERWQSATASGRNSLFSAAEQAQFDLLYGLFIRYESHLTHEQQAWAHLRALETWRGPLGETARLAFARDLQEARYEAWDLRYAGTHALEVGGALQIALGKPDPQTPSICLPMDTPRAEVVRQSPFGQP